ncbi:hypothetical protein BYT27DRAFT_7247461 [Phlegmacium glaucopus]|nr:hypothetical protein BYT27DRAFT_7247461 [Phlegmacium glaucopus]
MATDKPLLLSAILGNIEVEGDVENGKQSTQSQYSVRLYVADKEVAKSTKSKPSSSVLKWEWNAENTMWGLGLVIDLLVDIHLLVSAGLSHRHSDAKALDWRLTFSESEFECFHHLLTFATPPPLAMSTNTSDNNANNANNTRNDTNDGDDSPIGEFFLFTMTAATSHTTSP